MLLLLVPLLAYLIYPPEGKTSKEIPVWGGKSLPNWARSRPRNGSCCGWFCWRSFCESPLVLNVRVAVFGTRNFINATTVVLVGIALMLITGVVSWDDILANKGAWNVLVWFATLVSLANGLNLVGFVRWFADLASAPLKGMDPVMVIALLVALSSSSTISSRRSARTQSAVLPLVLGVGVKLLPAAHITPFALLCVYALGLMGVLHAVCYRSRADLLRQWLYLPHRILETRFDLRARLLIALLAIGMPYLLNVKL